MLLLVVVMMLAAATASLHTPLVPAVADDGQTFCGFVEHVHGDDSCYADVLVCGMENTDGHSHDEGCYEYQAVVTCGLEEAEGHEHSSSCYEASEVLVCTAADLDHVHSDECYSIEETLACGLVETPGHVHDDSCYSSVPVLVCGLEETAPHAHSEECYELRLVCGQEEHTHSLQCYSNPDADVEDTAVWMLPLYGATLTGNPAADLAVIAGIQVGYAESSANYLVDPDGTTVHGYSRYGAFYGAPYADWSALFCSFCLQYLGIESLGVSDDCQAWLDDLVVTEAYRSPYSHIPAAGDLVFIDADYDGLTDHVGVVASCSCLSAADNLYYLDVVIGDWYDSVVLCSFSLGDSCIVGFAALSEPEAPQVQEESQLVEQVGADVSSPDMGGTNATLEAETPMTGLEASMENQTAADADNLTAVDAQVSDDGMVVSGDPLDNSTIVPEDTTFANSTVSDGVAATDGFDSGANLTVASDPTVAANLTVVANVTTSDNAVLPENAVLPGNVTLMGIGADGHVALNSSLEDAPLNTTFPDSANTTTSEPGNVTLTSLSPKTNVTSLDTDPVADANSTLGTSSPRVKKLASAIGVGESLPLRDYITEVTGSGTVEHDTGYSTILEMHFTITAREILDVIDNQDDYIYLFPDAVTLSDSLIAGSPYTGFWKSDPTRKAFSYSFFKAGPDGPYGINIMFDEDYIESIPDPDADVENSLRFAAFISGEGIGEREDLIVDFSDEIRLVIGRETISSDVDIAVSKGGWLDVGDKLHYYVIVSSDKGTPGPIHLDDTLSFAGNATFSDVSVVSIIRTEDGVSTDVTDDPNINLTLNPNDPKVFSLDMPSLPAGGQYYIVYEYSLGGLTGNQEVHAANDALATSSSGNKTIGDFDVHIINSVRPMLSKSGTDNGDGTVTWTITVNSIYADIANEVLTDDMFAGLTADDITIENAVGTAVSAGEYSIAVDGNGKITSITFLPTDGGTTNFNSYTITYTTPVEGVAFGEYGTVDNTATFQGDSVESRVGVIGGSLQKSVQSTVEPTSSAAGSITWEVALEIPAGGLEANSTISDSFVGEGHYMTVSQALALSAGLATAWGTALTDLEFVGADDSVVAAADLPTYAGQIVGYRFKTPPDSVSFAEGATLSWSYTTTADMTGATTRTFGNLVNVAGVEVSASQAFTLSNVRKLNTNMQAGTCTIVMDDAPETDHSFRWFIEVKPGSADGTGTYRITDTLPAGVVLKAVYLSDTSTTRYNYSARGGQTEGLSTISFEAFRLWGARAQVVGTYSDQVLNVTISPVASCAYSDIMTDTFYLVLDCELADDAWPEGGTTETLQFDNSVSVQKNDEYYGEAQNTQYVEATSTEHVVTKQGLWNSESKTVQYTLDVNPNAKDLWEGDTLTLTDVLTYVCNSTNGYGEAVLNLSSLTVLAERDGVLVPATGVQWTVDSNLDPTNPNIMHSVINMTIPDGVHLVVTYVYSVWSTMSEGLTLDNTATLVGHEDAPGEDEHHFDAEDFNTSGDSDYKVLQLVKVDSDDIGEGLEGAQFEASAWNGTAWSSLGKVYVTDSNGEIIIAKTDKVDGEYIYAVDTAYRIVEIAPPVGYKMNDTPPVVYFWFSKNAPVPESAPDGFLDAAHDITRGSYRVVVTNQMIDITYEMPQTGGVGTLPYMLAGAALLLGGIYCCIRRGVESA